MRLALSGMDENTVWVLHASPEFRVDKESRSITRTSDGATWRPESEDYQRSWWITTTVIGQPDEQQVRVQGKSRPGSATGPRATDHDRRPDTHAGNCDSRPDSGHMLAHLEHRAIQTPRRTSKSDRGARDRDRRWARAHARKHGSGQIYSDRSKRESRQRIDGWRLGHQSRPTAAPRRVLGVQVLAWWRLLRGPRRTRAVNDANSDRTRQRGCFRGSASICADAMGDGRRRTTTHRMRRQHR